MKFYKTRVIFKIAMALFYLTNSRVVRVLTKRVNNQGKFEGAKPLHNHPPPLL